MVTIVLILVAATTLTTTLLTLFGVLSRRSADDNELDTSLWRPATAEVNSTLSTRNRRFLLVTYRAGTQVIRNDVEYPFAGTLPSVGQRVPIRYDPAAPSRVAFDSKSDPTRAGALAAAR
jgi:hypothetical protein